MIVFVIASGKKTMLTMVLVSLILMAGCRNEQAHSGVSIEDVAPPVVEGQTQFPTADEVMAGIDNVGARQVLDGFWSDPNQFEQLTDQISGESVEWVSIAFLLWSEADAGASTSIGNALGAALAENPTAVLVGAGRYGIPMHRICKLNMIEPSDLEFETAYATRVAGLRAIGDPKLNPLKTDCLENLEAWYK